MADRYTNDETLSVIDNANSPPLPDVLGSMEEADQARSNDVRSILRETRRDVYTSIRAGLPDPRAQDAAQLEAAAQAALDSQPMPKFARSREAVAGIRRREGALPDQQYLGLVDGKHRFESPQARMERKAAEGLSDKNREFYDDKRERSARRTALRDSFAQSERMLTQEDRTKAIAGDAARARALPDITNPDAAAETMAMNRLALLDPNEKNERGLTRDIHDRNSILMAKDLKVRMGQIRPDLSKREGISFEDLDETELPAFQELKLKAERDPIGYKNGKYDEQFSQFFAGVDARLKQKGLERDVKVEGLAERESALQINQAGTTLDFNEAEQAWRNAPDDPRALESFALQVAREADIAKVKGLIEKAGMNNQEEKNFMASRQNLSDAQREYADAFSAHERAQDALAEGQRDQYEAVDMLPLQQAVDRAADRMRKAGGAYTKALDIQKASLADMLLSPEDRAKRLASNANKEAEAAAALDELREGGDIPARKDITPAGPETLAGDFSDQRLAEGFDAISKAFGSGKNIVSFGAPVSLKTIEAAQNVEIDVAKTLRKTAFGKRIRDDKDFDRYVQRVIDRSLETLKSHRDTIAASQTEGGIKIKLTKESKAKYDQTNRLIAQLEKQKKE